MAEEPAASASSTPAEPETREVEPPVEATPAREAAQTRDWTPPTKEFAAFTQSLESAGARQGAVEPPQDSAARPQPEQIARPSAEPSDVPPPPPPRVTVVSPRAEETTPAVAGEDSDGASDASDARGRVARVRDGTRARVGRMRDEAIVVLEETPDDSGLRFVVAAAALFVVFVVLLFLSTTVLR